MLSHGIEISIAEDQSTKNRGAIEKMDISVLLLLGPIGITRFVIARNDKETSHTDGEEI